MHFSYHQFFHETVFKVRFTVSWQIHGYFQGGYEITIAAMEVPQSGHEIDGYDFIMKHRETSTFHGVHGLVVIATDPGAKLLHSLSRKISLWREKPTYSLMSKQVNCYGFLVSAQLQKEFWHTF